MLADILVFVFVLFFVYTGYKSGLVKTLFGLLSYFLSIGLSIVLYPYISDIISKLPFIQEMVSGISDKFSDVFFAEVSNPLVEYIMPTVGNSVSTVAYSAVINILSFISVLILSRLILGILSRFLNIFAKLPIISLVNRLGGAVVGGLKGIILLYIIFLIILLVPKLGDGKVAENIYSSQIANKFYSENIIIDILGKDIFDINGK